MIKKIIWLFIAAPCIYLAVVWKNLPEKVAVHFNMQGVADRFGNKLELLSVTAMLTVISTGVYLLLINLHRIDPKRYGKDRGDRSVSMAATIVIFLSAIHFLILYSAAHGSIRFNRGLILAGVGLLFSVLGNYMYNIKPNYFVGMRLPWTLDNEENWKRTHQLAGRLWFGAGILLAVLCLLLPPIAANIVFFSGTAIITLIPAIYSYRMFIKQKKNN